MRFMTMEYYFLILNRTFEITVDENGVHGAIAGHLMSATNSKALTASATGNAYDLVSASKISPSHTCSAGSHKYLKLSFSNFSYSKDEIVKISYDRRSKWGMGPVPHTGKFYLTLSNGKQRELIVLGRPEIPALVSGIEDLGYTVHHT
ncbi:hypothetical protein [Microbulbifer hydrolyticus]|uniref:Uncharacterized protein n=1 Tax=Microbulbifer hydrolyticus TaxID=48074 RepID=A0A6P1T816_9GAMM|nr:hypothetical protein [Microbulbifer hydrolyticus]MBB5211412.1 hypothetical protein [Microbulbifer hydrolyticus]QHQ37833.1 hypothetical protein GTQ55_01710 [Microbulbifer hydrolyticus]